MSALTSVLQYKWTVLLLLLTIYLGRKYRQYRKLDKFPGPFSTGWFELWHIRTLLSMRSHYAYKEVNDKYGK